jgi:hypothetical protein
MNDETQLPIRIGGVNHYPVPNIEGAWISRNSTVWISPRIYSQGGHEYRCKGRMAKLTIRKDGYTSFVCNRKRHYLHRAMGYAFLGLLPDQEIDHRDRNPMNNRISNLRVATRSQNTHNTRAKGYTLCKATGKFRAAITVNRKIIQLGRHDTEEQASAAYLQAKRDLVH